MTKTCAVAAFAWMCAAPLAAQTPLPVPPIPPAPPAAPVHVAPDLFHDLDLKAFAIDHDAWKADLDAWKADFDLFKHDFKAFDFHAPFELAQQVPTPANAVSPPIRVSVNTGNEGGLYDQARNLIDRDQYTRALELFERIIASGGERADDSMYWKAYSLMKVARATDALAAIADLEKRFPKSPWADSARSLAVEVKQAAGQPVGAVENNDEITLLALRGLMQSDPETALPMIEKMLGGNKSVRVKTQALYVVSQSRSPRGREIITNVAKGNANPELKMAAVRSLGQMSGPESRQALSEIYRTSSDVDVKRMVIRSLQSANAADELSAIARTEKDPELRRNAIRFLGSTNRPEVVETLRTIYLGDENLDVKREVIRALNSNRSGGAKVLVDLARQEKNVELKTEIVRVLSGNRDPVAKEYMLELLK